MKARGFKTTERPAVLLVDTVDERRQRLSAGLAESGYEVIPASTGREALKFAAGLGPSVIVGPVALLEAEDGAILEYCRGGDVLERTILLLASRDEAAAAGELPDAARLLEIEGLAEEEILRRIRLVLVGREIGVEVDLDLRFLIGELRYTPFLELVRSLERCRLSGRLVLRRGFVAFEGGAVIAAAVKTESDVPVRGLKAFCRLGRRKEGPVRITIGPTGEDPEIQQSVDDLVLQALEESQIEIPPPRTRLRVLGEERQSADELSTHQNLLLDLVGRCETVGELLDNVPSTDGRILQALDKMIARGAVRLERPRSKLVVVTDSTADLPPELVREHDVVTVPLSVAFGEDVLRDGVDLLPRDFYEMLSTVPEHPATQPPAEAEFFEHYADLLLDQDVLSVHISAKMSDTVENARQAADRVRREVELPEERRAFALELVDSHTVSMGLGLLVLFAARMAHRGESAAIIGRRLEAMRDRVHTLFAVDTLDYLLKGGRIGKAQAWVGRFLGIKPILGVADGEVVPIDRVMGGRQAHPRIVKLLGERVEARRPIVAAVVHARAPVWAERLRALLERSFDCAEMIVTDVGPVVGTHAGPGTVGTAVFQPTDEEWESVRALD